MNDIFSAIIILGIGIVIFLLISLKKKPSQEDNLLIMQRIGELSQSLDSKLAESSRSIQNQSNQNMKIVKEVTEEITKLKETNKQVVGFADQLQSLEDILKNPKQRGIFGEYILEELLKNVFSPSQYQMQYRLGKDENTGKELIADAVLFVKDKMIPIDSKFSLENYNRIIEERDQAKREELEKIFKQDLKNRIDETSKYIKPNKGTFEFALMFIPAEAIYYDLLVNKIGAIKANTRDLIDYAIREKHVHIVSPTSFYAYLQTIIQGLRAMQIEESAKEIKKRVEMLGRHIESYESYFQKIGNNLVTTVKSYNSAYKELGKMDKDVVKIAEREPAIEVKEIDGPKVEEE